MLIKNICETQTLLGIMRRPVSLKEHINAENYKFVRGHVNAGNLSLQHAIRICKHSGHKQ